MADIGKDWSSFKLNTGARIPSIGLGTGKSAPNLVSDAVTTAIKIGFALKKLLEDRKVNREDLWITSKLWCTNLAPKHVPDALERTLRDLPLDYVDLYLVFGFAPENLLEPDIRGTWRAMEKLYDLGKARAIGVSNFSVKKLGDLINIARVPPAVNQVECHPLWSQPKLRAFCKSKGVHLSGHSPLGSPGFISMKTKVLENPIVKEVADKLGKTPAQVALRWGLQMGHSVLPKSTNESRIRDNFNIFGWTIPDDLLSKFQVIEQCRLVRAEVFANETSGPYKTVEEKFSNNFSVLSELVINQYSQNDIIIYKVLGQNSSRK